MERVCQQQQDMSSLSQDLIFQILSWASPEALLSSRQVCTEWRSIVEDPKFQTLHRDRGRARYVISGYFIQSDERRGYFYHDFPATTFVSLLPLPPSIPPPSLDFLLEGLNIRIVSSTYGGLLCCASDMTESDSLPHYYVCKPTTKQWRVIPDPDTESYTTNLAIVVRSINTIEKLEFKIVRILIRDADAWNIMQCEIFESAAWAWRRLKEISGLEPDSLSRDPSVEIGGVVYWLQTRDYFSIFAFDVEREDWKLILMPKWTPIRRWRQPTLVASDGELRLLRFRKLRIGQLMIMWIMKKNSEEESCLWEREDIILLESEDELRDLCSSNVAFLTSTSSEAIWFDLCKSKMLNGIELSRHTVPSDLEVVKFESDHTPISLLEYSRT